MLPQAKFSPVPPVYNRNACASQVHVPIIAFTRPPPELTAPDSSWPCPPHGRTVPSCAGRRGPETPVPRADRRVQVPPHKSASSGAAEKTFMAPKPILMTVHAASNVAVNALLAQGFAEDAVSRAYYTMFYLAEAFLDGEGLAFTSHAAFGRIFAKSGRIPAEFH